MSETKPLTIDEVGFEPKKRFCEKHPGWQLRNVQDNPNGCDTAEDFRCPLCLRLEFDAERKAHEQTREQLAHSIDVTAPESKEVDRLVYGTEDNVTFLYKELQSLRQTREIARELAEYLTLIAPEVCSYLCPSIKYSSEPWQHVPICVNLRVALAKYHAQLPEEKQ